MQGKRLIIQVHLDIDSGEYKFHSTLLYWKLVSGLLFPSVVLGPH